MAGPARRAPCWSSSGRRGPWQSRRFAVGYVPVGDLRRGGGFGDARVVLRGGRIDREALALAPLLSASAYHEDLAGPAPAPTNTWLVSGGLWKKSPD